MATKEAPEAWKITKQKYDFDKSDDLVTTTSTVPDPLNPEKNSQQVKHDFVNEKREEWPIWNKITEFFSGPKKENQKVIE